MKISLKLKTDDYCCWNVTHSINRSCHHVAQTLPPFIPVPMRLTGLQRKCELLSSSWQWTQDELWTLDALWTRTRATRSLPLCTQNACRCCSSQIKSTKSRLDLIFFCLCLRIWSRVMNIFDNKTSSGFLVWPFSWWKTLLVNIQGKNANVRRRFWWSHIIAHASHWKTATIVWHNTEDFNAIASTKTDGIICRWPCCHSSREEFFFCFFYRLIWFVSWGNWCLVYPKQTITKQRIVIAWRSIFTPSAVISLLNVRRFFWVGRLGGERQLLLHGHWMEEFIKPFPNKEINSDKIQLALKW